jgi:transcriptional regulator with XRE-family HTH domain
MTFAEWLRQTREERGLTQTEVGEAIGHERAYVNKLEKKPEGYYPAVDLLDRLARGMGTTILEALISLGFIDRDDLRLKPGEEKLLSIHRNLPLKEREGVLDFARMRMKKTRVKKPVPNVAKTDDIKKLPSPTATETKIGDDKENEGPANSFAPVKRKK